MGQLFNRLSGLFSSQASSVASNLEWAEKILAIEDDELRKIISELNAGTSAQQGRPVRHSRPDVDSAMAVLGLDNSHTPEDIKPAYRKAIAQWHPDIFVNAQPALHANAQTRASQINAAYILLKRHFGIA